jgi:UDP-N-acetylglucosamine transferase subunit ALG13
VTPPDLVGTPGRRPPRVMVIVGTDHHPFDRLITWVNGWLDRHPDRVGEFFVQWGAAAVRPVCAGAQFLTSDQLSSVLEGAGAVVCHGGGGSISDAWARGIVPIVVPRRRRLGEHVDDHQIHFSAKLAELGYIRVAQTPAEFTSLLDGLSRAPLPGDQRTRIGSQEADVQAVVARFGTLVDELVSRPPHRRRLLAVARRTGSRLGADIGPPAGDPAPDVVPAARISPQTTSLARVDLAEATNGESNDG